MALHRRAYAAALFGLAAFGGEAALATPRSNPLCPAPRSASQRLEAPAPNDCAQRVCRAGDAVAFNLESRPAPRISTAADRVCR